MHTPALEILVCKTAGAWPHILTGLTGLGLGAGAAALGHGLMAGEPAQHLPTPEPTAPVAEPPTPLPEGWFDNVEPDEYMARGPVASQIPERSEAPLPHSLDPSTKPGYAGWLPPVHHYDVQNFLSKYGPLPDDAKATAVDVLEQRYDPQHTGQPTIRATSQDAPVIEPAIRDALNAQGGRYNWVSNSTIDSKIHEGLKPIWPLIDRMDLAEQQELARVLHAHAQSVRPQ